MSKRLSSGPPMLSCAASGSRGLYLHGGGGDQGGQGMVWAVPPQLGAPRLLAALAEPLLTAGGLRQSDT